IDLKLSKSSNFEALSAPTSRVAAVPNWSAFRKADTSEISAPLADFCIAPEALFIVSPKPRFSLNPYLYQLCIFHETKRMFFMQIGYIRVSTNDQNTDLQRNALNCAGCELIFEDKISGTKS